MQPLCSSTLRPVLAGICSTVFLACGADTHQTLGNQRAALHARDRDELWAGKTLEEWAVEYFRWYNSPSDCDGFPSDDTDGSLCGRYQHSDSPVFFLERSPFAQGTVRTFERNLGDVPGGKAILVPVASFFGDSAGMEHPMSDEEIEATVAGVKQSMRDLELVADGTAVDHLNEAGFGPSRFSYHIPPAPNRYGCDASSGLSDVFVEPSFLAGYFVLFDPPAPGDHELDYASTLTFFGDDYSFRVKSTFHVAAE